MYTNQQAASKNSYLFPGISDSNPNNEEIPLNKHNNTYGDCRFENIKSKSFLFTTPSLLISKIIIIFYALDNISQLNSMF